MSNFFQSFALEIDSSNLFEKLSIISFRLWMFEKSFVILIKLKLTFWRILLFPKNVL